MLHLSVCTAPARRSDLMSMYAGRKSTPLSCFRRNLTTGFAALTHCADASGTDRPPAQQMAAPLVLKPRQSKHNHARLHCSCNHDDAVAGLGVAKELVHRSGWAGAPHWLPMPPEAAGTWQRMPCVAHACDVQATHALLTAAGFFAGFLAGLGCGVAPAPSTAGVVSRVEAERMAAYSLTAPRVIGAPC